MPDETVETRRPWRGSPCPAIRGRAFLCIVCIIQQYLGSFAIPHAGECAQPVTWDKAPYAVAKKKKCDDKTPPLCYNQLKALYFCKRHHITVFTGAHHFEEGRPLRIILQRTWKFSMLYLPINSRKIEMPYVDRMQKM